VNQLKTVEQTIKARVVVAEKTIEDYQYVGAEDLHRAKELLGIVQDIHLWRPLGPVPTLESFQQNQRLQFVYDQTLKVSIDMSKMGKAPDAVQVSIIEEDPSVAFDLSLTEKQPVAISALKPKKRKSFVEVRLVSVPFYQCYGHHQGAPSLTSPDSSLSFPLCC